MRAVAQLRQQWFRPQPRLREPKPDRAFFSAHESVEVDDDVEESLLEIRFLKLQVEYGHVTLAELLPLYPRQPLILDVFVAISMKPFVPASRFNCWLLSPDYLFLTPMADPH